MADLTFDRYNIFKENGVCKIVPHIDIPPRRSDYFETYIQGISRLDNISYKYYKNANYDWLILMANPEVGSLEFNIPDGYKLRIPYPLDITLQTYNSLITDYYEQYN